MHVGSFCITSVSLRGLWLTEVCLQPAKLSSLWPFVSSRAIVGTPALAEVPVPEWPRYPWPAQCSAFHSFWCAFPPPEIRSFIIKDQNLHQTTKKHSGYIAGNTLAA